MNDDKDIYEKLGFITSETKNIRKDNLDQLARIDFIDERVVNIEVANEKEKDKNKIFEKMRRVSWGVIGVLAVLLGFIIEQAYNITNGTDAETIAQQQIIIDRLQNDV